MTAASEIRSCSIEKPPVVGVAGLTGYSVFMQMQRLPAVGQTVRCNNLFTELGGKGHNQAAACARLGVPTCFAGAIGQDDWGYQCKVALKADGIVPLLIETKRAATAFGLIQTDADGQNTVSVYPGAAQYFRLTDLLPAALKLLRQCKLLLIQAELGKNHVIEMLRFGEEAEIPVILNPAPAISLEKDLLARFYAITPNENEAKFLTGLPLEADCPPEKLAHALAQAGARRAVITLGKKGAVIMENGTVCYVKPYPVSYVSDTTGAGDTFNGALAVGIIEGKTLFEAVRFAAVASGLSVTKKGALSSIPYRAEVDRHLDEWKGDSIMRRSDREITDKDEIIKIIEKCDVCRIALSNDNIPYIVPMNYGYQYADGKLTLYFHGAKEGKKLDIIAKNPLACFEMDCSHKLIEADEAWNYTMEYESVIGNGKISLCTEKSEKLEALKQLMKKYAKGKDFSFPDRVIETVGIFKLDVSEFTGKRLVKS